MFAELQFVQTRTVSYSVNDPIQRVLKKLLETEDLAEFKALSVQLRSMLHERVEQLRKEAKSLKPGYKMPDRRKRPRNGAKKP